MDGTDFRINEPTPFDRKWYSHKFNGPGVCYEISIRIATGHIVWVNGPFCCGRWPDIKIAEKHLVKHLDRHERVIADSGYRNGGHFITPTGHNNLQEHEHSVIRARHETVNGQFKNWNILKKVFRHNVRKHGPVFWAVANITQLELTTTNPVFQL